MMATVLLYNGELDEEGNVLVVYNTLQGLLRQGGAEHIAELARACVNRGQAVAELSRQTLFNNGLVAEDGTVKQKSIRDIVNSAVVLLSPVTLIWPVQPNE